MKWKIEADKETIKRLFFENEPYFDMMQKKHEELIAQHSQLINQRLLDIIRDEATPPIKGNITLNKLKWRGITIGCSNDMGDIIYTVEQRGEELGNVRIQFEVNIEE